MLRRSASVIFRAAQAVGPLQARSLGVRSYQRASATIKRGHAGPKPSFASVQVGMPCRLLSARSAGGVSGSNDEDNLEQTMRRWENQNQKGKELMMMSDTSGAEEALLAATETARELVQHDRKNGMLLGESMLLLATLTHVRGDPETAHTLLKESEDTLTKALGDIAIVAINPEDHATLKCHVQHLLARTFREHSTLCTRLGIMDDAVTLFQRQIGIHEEIMRSPVPPLTEQQVTRARFEMAEARAHYAMLLTIVNDDMEGAEREALAALEGFRGDTERLPADLDSVSQEELAIAQGTAHQVLSSVEGHRGNRKEALDHFISAESILSDYLDADHDMLNEIRSQKGMAQAMAGELEGAMATLQDAISRKEQRGQGFGLELKYLGIAHKSQGNLDEADATLHRAIVMLAAEQHMDFPSALGVYMEVLNEKGEHEKFERVAGVLDRLQQIESEDGLAEILADLLSALESK